MKISRGVADVSASGRERGFSLPEVLVAIGIMGMLIMSVAQLFLFSNYVNRYVEEISRLSNIAQYQIEDLRRLYLSSTALATELENNSASRKSIQMNSMTATEFQQMLESRHAYVMVWSMREHTKAYEDRTAAGKFYGAYPATFADNPDLINLILTDGGVTTPVMAWVYWWVRPSGLSGLLEVQLHVDSGYRNIMGVPSYKHTPILGTASVRQVVYIAGRDYY
jgi:prepilin-type N-terminal cleavage/methylation domain-containing protein